MIPLTKFRRIYPYGIYWRLEFNANDMWVGLFRKRDNPKTALTIYYVCIIPMLVLRIDYDR